MATLRDNYTMDNDVLEWRHSGGRRSRLSGGQLASGSGVAAAVKKNDEWMKVECGGVAGWWPELSLPQALLLNEVTQHRESIVWVLAAVTLDSFPRTLYLSNSKCTLPFLSFISLLDFQWIHSPRMIEELLKHWSWLCSDCFSLRCKLIR